MRRLIKALFFLSLAILPTGVMADTTATTTLTVTIPERPVMAEVLNPCEFVVVEGGHSATCTITVAIADPTVRNVGWRLGLAAETISCECGGTLPPNALTVSASSGLTVIQGQPIDATGGPRLQANAVGRGLSPHASLLVAKPGYGNGAYAVTVQLRLMYPTNTAPGVYVPDWSFAITPDAAD